MKPDAELEKLLLEVLDEAMSVDDAASGKIRCVQPDTGCLEIKAQRGFSEEFVRRFRVVEIGDGTPSARAARLRRRVVVPDLAKSHADPFSQAAETEGFRAVQATPIVDDEGALLGTLSTHFPRAHATSASAGLVLDHCARRAAKILRRFSREA